MSTEDHDDIVDDDGHTLADITPMHIDEDDDQDNAVNAPDDPEEYLNWDRDRDGGMWEYATEDEADEPVCYFGEHAEKGE